MSFSDFYKWLEQTLILPCVLIPLQLLPEGEEVHPEGAEEAMFSRGGDSLYF